MTGMTPFCRVWWTRPDETKRNAAAARAVAAAQLKSRQMTSFKTPEELFDEAIAAEPDADAVREYFGVLLTVPTYVPGHIETDERDGSLPRYRNRVVPARWVALVATSTGVREVNPLELQVIGAWQPGEPIERPA